MKHLLILLLFPLFPLLATSAPIDPDAALRRLEAALRPRTARSDAARQWELKRRTESVYLFADRDGAFAVAAADDRLPALMAYGTRGGEAMPDALEGLLRAWDKGLGGMSANPGTPTAGFEPVAPLLSAVRHQLDPYNRHCPRYRSADGTLSPEPCVVGCVATALEEVITFHRRVVTLRDTLHGWSTPHYDIPDILPGESVDTRLILDNYSAPAVFTEEQADAVARLSYWCGVASRMNWGTASSGTRLSRLEEPLRRAFGWGYVHYADSYKYLPEDWLAMLRAEIRAGRPVVYSGFSMHRNGHAFVLDGIDSDGLFHVNWGVDGDYDGYFRIDLLNAAEPAWDTTPDGFRQGFFCNQEALLLHPDPVDATLPDTLCRTGREIVVDSLFVDLPPAAGKCSPVRIYLRNTAPYALTTPLELFTNAPTDTALFEQGDYIALGGITLEAGEQRMLCLMPQFRKTGQRVLRLSPDDVHLIHETPLYVANEKGALLSFDIPVLRFPSPGEVAVEQTIRNAGNAGRAGWKVTYELFEGTPRPDHNGTAHADYCLLPPDGEETDSVVFRGLKPETDYTLLVRYPWEPQHTVRFTLPSATGIPAPTASDDTPVSYFDLSGRRLPAPPRKGLYIRRSGKTAEVRIAR